MKAEEFQSIFYEECDKNGIVFDEKKSELLYRYMNLILEWNEKINVTAIKNEKEFIVKHFIDCLMVNRFVKGSKNLLDIGTGAGFPGIPLKIYNPNMKVTLIDSVNKKLMILEDVIEKLKLEDIETFHIRAEDLAKNMQYRESFEIVTTRAVACLATIVEYMLPFLKIGGKAICMKGPDMQLELQEAKKAIKLLGGEIEMVESFFINDEFERNIVVIKKIIQTDKKYPRGQGKPVKIPIK